MTLYKSKIRIATKEYCFLEIDSETQSIEEAIEQSNMALKFYERSQSDIPGLSVRDFSRLKRDIINGQGYEMETFDGMNKAQKYVIKEIEKTIKQITSLGISDTE